jgi:hypothetical protein
MRDLQHEKVSPDACEGKESGLERQVFGHLQAELEEAAGITVTEEEARNWPPDAG